MRFVAMSSPLTHPNPITLRVPEAGAADPPAPDAPAPEPAGPGVLPLLHPAAARTNASSVGMKAARRLTMTPPPMATRRPQAILLSHVFDAAPSEPRRGRDGPDCCVSSLHRRATDPRG